MARNSEPGHSHRVRVVWEECGCRKLSKSVCAFLLVGLLCFSVEEYVSFGMWDAQKYTDISLCSEQLYNFGSTGDIFDDQELMTSCGVHETGEKFVLHDLPLEDGHPMVKTKCSQKAGELLSFRRPTPQSREEEKDFQVPNIVHYVSLGNWTFTFLNYLSFRSVDAFIKPRYIFVVGDGLPLGPWWNRTLSEVANIYHVDVKRPERVRGRKTRWLEHSSDIIRLQTILDNGGIYLDTDILVLRSFDPLRGYELTLGRETWYGLGSGVIVSRPHAPFVCMWFSNFRNYNPFPWNWAYYAVHTPHHLAKVIPERVHVEEHTLHKPAWNEAYKLFKQTVDWSDKYSVHVWKRYGTVPDSPAKLDGLNSTLGQIMRYIYHTPHTHTV